MQVFTMIYPLIMTYNNCVKQFVSKYFCIGHKETLLFNKLLFGNNFY